MGKENNLTDFLTDVANAIREKKGSSEKINPQNFSEEIKNLPSGGITEVEEKEVNFYDYDGTLLFSYTISEVQALTELPTPKGHEGLIFDGWNWDYEDVIVLDYPMNIGAMYCTDDGATRLYLEVEEPTKINFHCENTGELTIDFGDGKVETTTAATVDIEHTYAVGGYVIRLSGTALYKLSNAGEFNIFGHMGGKSAQILRKVEIGSNCVVGGYAFRGCVNLYSISVPINTLVYSLGSSYTFQFCNKLKHLNFTKGSTGISYFMFDQCTNLKAISYPNKSFSLNFNGALNIGIEKIYMNTASTNINCSKLDLLKAVRISPKVISIPTNAFAECKRVKRISLPSEASVSPSVFSHCWSLESVELPQNMSSIPSQLFYYCRTLRYVKIPHGVKSVGANAFNTCTLLRMIDFGDCETIPTLENTNVFSGTTTIMKIVVPDNLYDEWIAATNWSAYTDRIFKASEFVKYNNK